MDQEMAKESGQDRSKRKLYVCDPMKNTECKKTACVHRQDVPAWFCELTDKKEFAVLDEHGEPIEADARTGVTYPVFRAIPAICRDDC